MHKACLGNYVDCVRLLIHLAPATVNARDGHGWTPLMRAAWKGHRETTRLLLQYKADTLATNRDGHTAVDIARKSKFGDGASTR